MTRKKAMSKHENFKRVFIRKSMSFEERQQIKKLQMECNEKNKENTETDPSSTFVIYAGKIIRRRDIVTVKH